MAASTARDHGAIGLEPLVVRVVVVDEGLGPLIRGLRRHERQMQEQGRGRIVAPDQGDGLLGQQGDVAYPSSLMRLSLRHQSGRPPRSVFLK